MSDILRQGDIVEIPHPNGKHFVGWVVYVSQYFKNLIGVSVYGEAPADIDIIGTGPSNLKPIYTSSVAAKHYGWFVVGHKEVTAQDILQTLRIVGGEVFTGDECIRSATESDRANLPEMMAMGIPVVYDQLDLLRKA